MSAIRPRLPAAERRAALLDAACGIFCKRSYRGTTTADIAREAGVTEPVLYRHFESKRQLYLSCLGETWDLVRASWEKALRDEPDPANWLPAMGRAYFQRDPKRQIANLWLQSLAEASEDPEIRGYLRKHIREVHDFVVDVVQRSQQAGGVLPGRDPVAEAWIFISVGLLTTVDRRLGALLGDDFVAIISSRRRWLTGREDLPVVP